MTTDFARRMKRLEALTEDDRLRRDAEKLASKGLRRRLIVGLGFNDLSFSNGSE